MPSRSLPRSARVLTLLLNSLFAVSMVQAQGAKQPTAQAQISDTDADHIKERDEWFFRGRLVQGKSSAELRRRAYLTKLQLRAQHAAALAATPAVQGLNTSGPWTP